MLFRNPVYSLLLAVAAALMVVNGVSGMRIGTFNLRYAKNGPRRQLHPKCYSIELTKKEMPVRKQKRLISLILRKQAPAAPQTVLKTSLAELDASG